MPISGILLCYVLVYVSVNFTYIFQSYLIGSHEENETDEHATSIYYEQMI